MSCKDFEKYLIKNPISVPGDLPQTRTFILVSDSKGGYLERLPKETTIENRIIFSARGGRTTSQAADIITYKLDNYLRCYGKITLGIWSFTCDFTSKSGRRICLNDLTVDQVILQCQRILSVCRPYGDRVKVVFLECPYYSISIWNQTKCHSLRDEFTREDQLLEAKIDELNLRLQDLNGQNGISAPKFSVDLKKFRKSNKVYKTNKISFGLLTDGVHPCEILSKYWLRRLINAVVLKECFD